MCSEQEIVHPASKIFFVDLCNFFDIFSENFHVSPSVFNFMLIFYFGRFISSQNYVRSLYVCMCCLPCFLHLLYNQ